MPTRKEVYDAIDSERAYQATRWNPSTTSTGGVHDNVESWLVYMEDYLDEAKHVMSRTAHQDAIPQALGIVRKVTALGVACMEQLGAPRREGF